MPMFGILKNKWNSARGTILRQEFEDALGRLHHADAAITEAAQRGFLESLRNFQSTLGPLEALSEKRKLQIAQKLSDEGKKIFYSDTGRAYGIALTSMLIEADALPGEDALFVKYSLTVLLDSLCEDMGIV